MLNISYLVILRRSKKLGEPARLGIDGDLEALLDRDLDLDREERLLEWLRERLLARLDEPELDALDRLCDRELLELLLDEE